MLILALFVQVSRPDLSPLPGQTSVSFAEFLELRGEILSETTRWGNLSTKLEGYVGFDTIQEQIRRKSLKRGFEFNLMVVGNISPLAISLLYWDGSGFSQLMQAQLLVSLGNIHSREGVSYMLMSDVVNHLYPPTIFL